jgi:hypothetical protein
MNAKEKEILDRIENIDNEFIDIITCLIKARSKNNSEKKFELKKALVYLNRELEKLK